jgi:hypothetical protein
MEATMDLKERIQETWSAVNDLSWVDFETEIKHEKFNITKELHDIFLDEIDYDVDDGQYVFCGTPLQNIALRYTEDDGILEEINQLLEEYHERYCNEN